MMHIESLNALRRYQPTSHPGYVMVLKSALDEAIAEMTPRLLRLDHVMRHIAKEFRVTPDEIRSIRRQENIRNARFAFCFLARKLTTKSFPEIGAYLTKNHSTVMYGSERGAELWRDSPMFREQVENARAAIIAESAAVDAKAQAA